ncbi:hypothetical protein C8Q79DRAFT_452065 [Trametes meyenii]|nr:hypothetical protein C8Q79DRAFT_452065 [Trametes meyenii]
MLLELRVQASSNLNPNAWQTRRLSPYFPHAFLASWRLTGWVYEGAATNEHHWAYTLRRNAASSVSIEFENSATDVNRIAADRTHVTASEFRPGDTGQRWEFLSVATGFVIRSLLSTEAAPLYLLFKDAMRDGQRLRVGPHPMVFHVNYPRKSFARISFSTDFSMDLDYHGTKTVNLVYTRDKEEPCQLWHLSQCDPLAHEAVKKDNRSNNNIGS